jgi:hypothetical protein
VASYAEDLDEHGSWSQDDEVGYVWRPVVAADWTPYSDGRWVWTAYGWTWCPYESWGWAPFHYGRWGYRAAFGWYWIPGAVWGPAWVSWSYGGGYAGWCPLGYRDAPVVVNVNITNVTIVNGSPWIYARTANIRDAHIGRHRVGLSTAVARTLTVTPRPTVQPSRDFRTTHVVPVREPRVHALGDPGRPRPVIGPPDRRLDRRSPPPREWDEQRRERGRDLPGGGRAVTPERPTRSLDDRPPFARRRPSLELDRGQPRFSERPDREHTSRRSESGPGSGPPNGPRPRFSEQRDFERRAPNREIAPRREPTPSIGRGESARSDRRFEPHQDGARRERPPFMGREPRGRAFEPRSERPHSEAPRREEPRFRNERSPVGSAVSAGAARARAASSPTFARASSAGREGAVAGLDAESCARRVR